MGVSRCVGGGGCCVVGGGTIGDTQGNDKRVAMEEGATSTTRCLTISKGIVFPLRKLLSYSQGERRNDDTVISASARLGVWGGSRQCVL